MKTGIKSVFILSILLAAPLHATIFGTVRGIAHDPDHRPVAEANVAMQSLSSEFKKTGKTDPNGEFEFLLALLVHLQILGACLSRAHRVTRWARPVDRFLGWHSTGCVSGSVVGLIL